MGPFALLDSSRWEDLKYQDFVQRILHSTLTHNSLALLLPLGFLGHCFARHAILLVLRRPFPARPRINETKSLPVPYLVHEQETDGNEGDDDYFMKVSTSSWHTSDTHSRFACS